MLAYIRDNSKKLPYAPRVLLTSEHYAQVVLGGIYTSAPFSAQGLDYETAMMGDAYYSPYDQRCWVFQAMQDPDTGCIWLVDTFHSELEDEGDGRKSIAFHQGAGRWRWRLDEALWDRFALKMADISQWEPTASPELFEARDRVHGVCFGPGNHSHSCDDWVRKGAEPSLLLQVGGKHRELSETLASIFAQAEWLDDTADEMWGLLAEAKHRGIDICGQDESAKIAGIIESRCGGAQPLADFFDMGTYLSRRCAHPGEVFEANGFSSHSFTGAEKAHAIGSPRRVEIVLGEGHTSTLEIVHIAIPRRGALIRLLVEDAVVKSAFHYDLTEHNLLACLECEELGDLEMDSFSPEHANRGSAEKADAAKELARAIHDVKAKLEERGY